MGTSRIALGAGWLLLASLSVGPALQAAEALVKMRVVGQTSFVFDPTNITIALGDTVTWTNTETIAHDTTHNTDVPPRLWASPLLTTNSFSFTFSSAGVFNYYCRTHFLSHTEETGSVNVVAPNLPPSVLITSPTNGASFFAPAGVTLKAEAGDADGQVVKVDFVIGTNSTPVPGTNPYILTVSLQAGDYAYTAVATDNQGAKATSSVVNVSVLAPPIITLGFAQMSPDGSFQFRINGGQPGQTCVIEACETLPNWAAIFTNTFPATKCLTCPSLDFAESATNLNHRYYRSRVFP